MVRNKVHEQHRRLTRTEQYDLAREEPLYVRQGRPRGAARGRLAGAVAQPDCSGQRSDGAVDGGPQPARGRSAHPAPPGLDFVEIAERTGINERTVRRVIEDGPIRCWSLTDGNTEATDRRDGLRRHRPHDMTTVLDDVHRGLGAGRVSGR